MVRRQRKIRVSNEVLASGAGLPVGAGIGAAVGFVIAGPPGAVVGSQAGFLGGGALSVVELARRDSLRKKKLKKAQSK